MVSVFKLATYKKPKDIESSLTQQTLTPLDFIPARESSFFIKLFRIYVRLLFKRRFKHVWLRQEYIPEPDSRTVYYLNHHSWWDGIIPLLLNEYRLQQEARALMEDKQMRQYPFFKKIGAFSINRDDPRKAVTSLRYAVQSMKRERASLFIYPEGKITPAGSDMSFEGGLAWLHSKLPEVDYVPIGIYMHTIRHDKPELHLHIGEAVNIDPASSNKETTTLLENKLNHILRELRKTAGFDNTPYELFP